MTVTHIDRRRMVRAVACPHPSCPAGVGDDCRTPNGWWTLHKARLRLASGETVTPAKLGRLTDAQAQRLEVAAHAGKVWAPRRWAMSGGDRAQITVVDKLEAKGLLVEVDHTDVERALALTAAGWVTYRTHRLVIRRLPDEEIAVREAAARAREAAR